MLLARRGRRLRRRGRRLGRRRRRSGFGRRGRCRSRLWRGLGAAGAEAGGAWGGGGGRPDASVAPQWWRVPSRRDLVTIIVPPRWRGRADDRDVMMIGRSRQRLAVDVVLLPPAPAAPPQPRPPVRLGPPQRQPPPRRRSPRGSAPRPHGTPPASRETATTPATTHNTATPMRTSTSVPVTRERAPSPPSG